MSLTAFPNGISSFGMPVIGPPHLWLPKDAPVYFTSEAADGGSNNGSGSYERPYSTIQYGVNKITAGASSGLEGAMIHVNPGRYNEQVTCADRRGIRLIGAGIGLSHIDLTGVSGTNIAPSAHTAGLAAFVMAARNFVVTGFTFKAILNTYGLYVGDGGRYNSSYNYVAQDSYIYGNLFDGDTFAGLYGMVVDGAKGLKIFDNDYFHLASGGILVNSGLNQTTRSCTAYWNRFKACRGFGVRIQAGVVRNWCTGPFNIFEDDTTTVMTNPAFYEAPEGPNAYVGNWEACANEFSGQTTDFHGGNYEGVAGNTMTHVSQA